MIRVYPSRLPGSPLEVHEHRATTVDGWLRANVAGYPGQWPQPIEIDVDGRPVPPTAWAETSIAPDSDVRIYPTPRDPTILSIIAVAVSIAFAVYAYLALRQDTTTQGDGTSLSLNTAKANTAKLGDPIREVFGRQRIYPDYLVQPVSRYLDRRTYQTSMFVCVGRGTFAMPVGGMRLGATPWGSFGDDVSLVVYQPGADVSGDARSENWFNSTEVGGTSSGTSGLDLSTTTDTETTTNADSVSVEGTSLTLNNATTTDADGDTSAMTEAPWSVGQVLTLKVAASFTAANSGLYSQLTGAAVAELVPYVGMPVLLTYNDADYSLYVASYTAGTAAVPGVGGSAARVVGSTAVATYDFSASPVTFDLTWQGVTYTVTLDADYLTIGVLVQAITDQLSGSGLAASQSGRVLAVGETASPYAGGSITYASLPEGLFGFAPVTSAGTATTGGTAATDPKITLAYNSAAGTAFSGIPEGTVSLAMGRGYSEYQVTAVDGLTISVERLTEAGVVDTTWTGWVSRTSSDYTASGLDDGDGWLGPFLVCPDGETCEAFEFDYGLPGGMTRYSSKGKMIAITITTRVAYRVYGSGAAWTVRSYSHTDNTEDGIGMTERITLTTPAQIEVKVRRATPMWGGNSREDMYWQGLRSRLTTRPSSYEGVTTIGLTVTTGTKLGAQSDRRFNVLATREYARGAARTVSGAYYHLVDSLDSDELVADTETIDYLEETYWTPRGEFFDHVAVDDSTSALDLLKLITQAGMGYFLLSEGLASAGREGIKSPTGAITPQRTTKQLETAFTAPSADDFDGVDVTYVDEVTWAEETVECRIPSADTAVKVESFKLEGVGTADRAYRIGMRRLMKYQGQRLTHSCSTGLMSMVYNYGDRVKLTDDIPGSSTTSAMVDEASLAGGLVTITVGELLDWTLPNPRCLIRFQDGRVSDVLTPTRLSAYSLTIEDSALPSGYGFATWILDDPTVDPPELIFCDSAQVGYDATISEITPKDDGSVDVTALQYDPSYYQYDDAVAP